MLPLPEEIAGPPQLQIFLRDLKAVVGLRQRLQAPPGLLAATLGHQHAVAFGLAAAHPAPQLVQLAQTEELGVLHHHQRGVGYVHAHLHHRGGYQNIRLSGGERRHDGVLLLRLHPSVQRGDPQVGEHLRLQLLSIGGDGFALVWQVIAVAHQRTDDEHLVSLRRLLADETVQTLTVPLVHREGVHLLPSGRQFVDDGHIQIPVDDQGQRSGNGGGGQHQHVGVLRLLPQRRPLGHTEAVLLIGDHQSQMLILHICRQQGVGADAQSDGTVRQSFQDGAALLGAGGTGQQGTGNAEPLKQWGQVFIVLPCQNFRGGHQRRLPPGLGGKPHAGGGHHGLAAAYITLTQPVHGLGRSHIRHGIADGAALRIRQRKR